MKPLAVIRAQATAGREPEWFGLAPIDAVRKVARKAGWPLDSVDLFELNEAFSVQALAVNRELGAGSGRVNVHGGAVALGHPIGASGGGGAGEAACTRWRSGARRGESRRCAWAEEMRSDWRWSGFRSNAGHFWSRKKSQYRFEIVRSAVWLRGL